MRRRDPEHAKEPGHVAKKSIRLLSTARRQCLADGAPAADVRGQLACSLSSQSK